MILHFITSKNTRSKIDFVRIPIKIWDMNKISLYRMNYLRSNLCQLAFCSLSFIANLSLIASKVVLLLILYI